MVVSTMLGAVVATGGSPESVTVPTSTVTVDERVEPSSATWPVTVRREWRECEPQPSTGSHSRRSRLIARGYAAPPDAVPESTPRDAADKEFIDVDPDTGIRDLHIPTTLMRSFGHADCGVYAQVIEAGDIAVGDAISEAEDLFSRRPSDT